MNDTVEKFRNRSVIQHGKVNDRVYLMKLAKEDTPDIIDYLDTMALARGYTKIFAKVPEFARHAFSENYYTTEARIPGFFDGEEDVYFMGKFLTKERLNFSDKEQVDEAILLAEHKLVSQSPETRLPAGYLYRTLGKSDVDLMAKTYSRVFQTYPFPIHDPSYLHRTMDDNVVYFGACKGNDIVALASAEMDIDSQNAEMTDFATLPGYRGKGIATYLLHRMEHEMQRRGIKTTYTIARATSVGINVVFLRMGYRYSGTLVNNTNISGSLESMNVWYKHFSGT